MVSQLIAVALAALTQLAAPATATGTAGATVPVAVPATVPVAVPGVVPGAGAGAGTASRSLASDPFETPFVRASDAAGFPATLALPAAALALLAAAGLILARRRARGPQLVQVIETTGLGSKRSLVVARIGSELLLLGVSESGIALLGTRPASLTSQPVGDPVAFDPRGYGANVPAMSAASGRLSNLFSRVRHGTARSVPPEFDACLVESTEDQELRRKLAQGFAGHVSGSVR